MSFVWEKSGFLANIFADYSGVEYAGIRRLYPCEAYQSAENAIYGFTRDNLEYSPERTHESESGGFSGLVFTDEEGNDHHVDGNDFAALREVNPKLFGMMMNKLPQELRDKVNNLIEGADLNKVEYLEPCPQPAVS